MAREQFRLSALGTMRIRMFEAVQTNSADAPLFWMELFDQDAQSSVGSCVCHNIREAVAAFKDFYFALKCSNDV